MSPRSAGCSGLRMQHRLPRNTVVAPRPLAARVATRLHRSRQQGDSRQVLARSSSDPEAVAHGYAAPAASGSVPSFGAAVSLETQQEPSNSSVGVSTATTIASSSTPGSPVPSGSSPGSLSTSPVWQQQQQPLEPERQEQQQQQEPRPNSVSQQQQDSASNGTNPSNHTPAPDATAAAAAPAAAAAAAAADAAGKKPSSNFAKRVVFGLILGLGGAAVVAAGGVPYLLVALLVVYQATQEYFGFITSKGISQGMTPPPVFVSIATTALCLSITLFTFVSRGKSGTAMSVAAFLLLAMNILVIKKPTFSQLTSSVFGLFYCGYLPSFWLKLRNLNVSAPDMHWPAFAAALPLPLPELTVGLYATLTSVACIIAADTGAYFVGKNLGRTKLTEISPKKTVEGALGGLASAIAVALLFWQLCRWPESWAAAAGYGVVTFFSSIFGDLIESIMKRDAGMKDSGDLIPGHGGLLDRFDSYMFSAAVAYFYITLLLPRFGLA